MIEKRRQRVVRLNEREYQTLMALIEQLEKDPEMQIVSILACDFSDLALTEEFAKWGKAWLSERRINLHSVTIPWQNLKPNKEEV